MTAPTLAELSDILFDAIDYDGNDLHTKQSHRSQGFAELYGGDTVDLNKVAQAVHSAAIAPLLDRIQELEAKLSGDGFQMIFDLREEIAEARKAKDEAYEAIACGGKILAKEWAYQSKLESKIKGLEAELASERSALTVYVALPLEAYFAIQKQHAVGFPTETQALARAKEFGGSVMPFRLEDAPEASAANRGEE